MSLDKLREERKMLEVEIKLQEDAMSAEDACGKLVDTMQQTQEVLGTPTEW
eukprot:CAMPEP_0175097148 /NCGR_PEP_ID=MMETSP0086_2-20121207/5125_1 /TAXON_ID=136419 /ORGANISM="Unknown Unknown, Strain D1" /LENGTH=50 /DNA_ID=CAMNT_0016370625 /DNA_START=30 /DNA_END=179 /DNA_ORIENTATION=-